LAPATIWSASALALEMASLASRWAPVVMSAASALARAVVSSASSRALVVISSAVSRARWRMPLVCSPMRSSAWRTAARGEPPT
jgi:hypothetical protein